MASQVAFFHNQKYFPGYEDITTATTARGFQEARGLAEGSKAARETVDVFTKCGGDVKKASEQIVEKATSSGLAQATRMKGEQGIAEQALKKAAQNSTSGKKGIIAKVANFAKNHKVLAGVAVAATLIGAVFAGTKIAEAKQAKQEKQDN